MPKPRRPRGLSLLLLTAAALLPLAVWRGSQEHPSPRSLSRVPAAIPGTPGAPRPAFRFVDLARSGRHSRALGVAAGKVVGWERPADRREPLAVCWRDGRATEIGDGDDRESVATAVNGSGEIVGWTTDGEGRIRARRWSPASGPPRVGDLPSLGGPSCQAFSLNDAGDIAGVSLLADGVTRHACLWRRGEPVDLGTLGGDRSRALGINNAGEVAGVAETADGVDRACLWRDGRATDLGTLGGDDSLARAVNDAGQVAGWARRADGARHAFLWHDGMMRDLGTLGGAASEAFALDTHGAVVGAAESVNGGERAFVYTEATGMLNLNTLLVNPPDWTLVCATAISATGEICGWGLRAGQARGFLLIPVRGKSPS